VKFKSNPIAFIQSNIKYYCHLTLPRFTSLTSSAWNKQSSERTT